MISVQTPAEKNESVIQCSGIKRWICEALDFPSQAWEGVCWSKCACGESGLTFAVFRPHMTCAVNTDVKKKRQSPEPCAKNRLCAFPRLRFCAVGGKNVHTCSKVCLKKSRKFVERSNQEDFKQPWIMLHVCCRPRVGGMPRFEISSLGIRRRGSVSQMSCKHLYNSQPWSHHKRNSLK